VPVGADRTTIAGLCMSLAQMIPEAGDRLKTEDGTVLEIVEASLRRVRKVRIHPVPRQGDGPPPSADDHDDV
jgi:putative hemolysin